MLGGSSVGGATSVTSAPSLVNAHTSLRATRLWLTSPTMAMRRPVEAAQVLADRVAVEQGLGGVLVPAVAGVDHAARHPLGDLVGHARRAVAHDDASTPIASMVSTVSRSDSPLFTDDVDTEKLSVSADRRLAACSKLRRVRVESS